MSIEHLKKQSRNLKKLLPDFIKSHPNGEAPLAQIQDLIARSSGYPSWHAAVSAKSKQTDASLPNIGFRVLNHDLYTEGRSLSDCVHFIDSDSCIFFSFIDKDLYYRLSVDLEDFKDTTSADALRINENSTDKELEVLLAQALVVKCKSLLEEHPNFLDAALSLGSSLNTLNRHAEAIEVCKPLFDNLCSLLPGGFSGFHGMIAPAHIENRNVYRLAHILTSAYIQINTEYGDEAASSITRAMLMWFPYDGLRFSRFLPKLNQRKKRAGNSKVRGLPKA